MSQLLADSPLRHAVFRLFYLGSIGTALGYTMQTTVAAWVMATLTPSQLMPTFQCLSGEQVVMAAPT